MRKPPTLTFAAILLLSAFVVRSEESPAPEELLPPHEGKDAYFPDAAFGMDVFFVVWQAGRIAEGSLVWGKGDPVGVGDIVGCRLDKAGKPLEARPFVVSAAADLQEKPRAAYGQDVFLVVWQDLRNGKDYDVYAARVSPEGKLLDADGLLVAGGERNQANPVAAFDGSNFWVVWQDFRSGKYAVHGARVSPSGKVLDAGGVILGDSGRSAFHRITPAVSSLGDGQSVVFWVAQSTAPGQGEPSGGCFVRDGKIEKTFPFKGHHYAAPANPAALAVGPKGFTVLWRNNAAVGRATPSRNANGAFFTPDGEKEPSDEKGTKGAFRVGGNIADPAVVWNGRSFTAAWHEALGEKKSFPVDVVRLTTISDEGKPSGIIHEVSGTRDSPACGAAVASDGAGVTLVVYEKHPDKGDVPVKVGARVFSIK
jgi:hypothetical protein